jgi:hypothetical protein
VIGKPCKVREHSERPTPEGFGAERANIASGKLSSTQLEHYARQQRTRTVGADLRDWELSCWLRRSLR